MKPFDPTPYLTSDYVPNGRSWHCWDCWGLICAVFAAEASIVLDPWDTVDCADKASVASAAAKEIGTGWVSLGASAQAALQPLDVLLFRDLGRPTHVGVVIAGTNFLHAREGAGVCVASLADRKQPWGRRLLDGYRHRLLVIR